jgi:outer membrane lipoprotein-sorting protein
MFHLSSVARFVSVCLVAGSAGVVSAAEPAVIAKARAYIASEAVLNGLRSVHYVGTLTSPDPAIPGQTVTMAMDIVFQRPMQQRITTVSAKGTDNTALDSYDVWQRFEDRTDPAKNRQAILSVEQVRRLRANTWENLAFFRGIESVGGRTEDLGPVTVDGIACQKIAFIHAPNIIFYRYFDVATGRLVLTETEAGGRIREEGEVIVSGIRFPKLLTTEAKDAKGVWQKVTITFEKVTVNETFPASYFAVPGYTAK